MNTYSHGQHDFSKILVTHDPLLNGFDCISWSGKINIIYFIFKLEW